MKPRNTEAARLQADYLARVKTALAGGETSEVDEIIQSVREHIEEELSQIAEEQISLVPMANVIERLGPPETYAQEEGVALGVAAKTVAVNDEKPSEGQTSPNGTGLLVLGILSMFFGPFTAIPGLLISKQFRPFSGTAAVGYFLCWLFVILFVFMLLFVFCPNLGRMANP